MAEGSFKKDLGALCARAQDVFLVIGAGHFGKRAVNILGKESGSTIRVVDKDTVRLGDIKEASVEKIQDDGTDYLVKIFPQLIPSAFIVPAVPFHLAAGWLKRTLEKDRNIRQSFFPEEITSFFPHTWTGRDGSLMVSYADFLCPEDCAEPADFCSFTKKERGKPLYDLINELHIRDFIILTIRSRQLSPGLGGYRAEDLRNLLERLKAHQGGKFLIATACRCHGILTAMETSPAGERGKGTTRFNNVRGS